MQSCKNEVTSFSFSVDVLLQVAKGLVEEMVAFLLPLTANGNAILEVLASLKMDFIFPHQFSVSLLQFCNF